MSLVCKNLLLCGLFDAVVLVLCCDCYACLLENRLCLLTKYLLGVTVPTATTTTTTTTMGPILNDKYFRVEIQHKYL